MCLSDGFTSFHFGVHVPCDHHYALPSSHVPWCSWAGKMSTIRHPSQLPKCAAPLAWTLPWLSFRSEKNPLCFSCGTLMDKNGIFCFPYISLAKLVKNLLICVARFQATTGVYLCRPKADAFVVGYV